ncbi:MAG: type II toxin-antitoxin system prevent-host-death family antitoxin [Deltaproteobacteria bacterium]|nr:type II toxin-antitoxin system prevent-host-death family antitoxin [Deltaproteobacteria bacterium]
MRQVGTAHLKNQLSAYLQKVRQGEHFVVTDHGKPIAQLLPFNKKASPLSLEEKLAHLAALGVLKLAKPRQAKKKHSKIKLGGDIASRYVIEDRE